MYPPLGWLARPRNTSTLNLGGRGRASSNTEFMFSCEISSDNSTPFADNFSNILDMTPTFQGQRIGVSLRGARVHHPGTILNCFARVLINCMWISQTSQTKQQACINLSLSALKQRCTHRRLFFLPPSSKSPPLALNNFLQRVAMSRMDFLMNAGGRFRAVRINRALKCARVSVVPAGNRRSWFRILRSTSLQMA